MRLLASITIMALLSACSHTSETGKKLSGSDSLVINFNASQTNNIDKTVITTESKAIKKLIRFVDSKSAGDRNCSYDGNLMFYKEGVLVGDVAFNYSADSCRHFMFSNKDKLSPTVMSNEAADFLKSLAEGRAWY